MRVIWDSLWIITMTTEKRSIGSSDRWLKMEQEITYNRYSRQLLLNDGRNKIRAVLQTGFYEPSMNNKKRHSHPLGEFYAILRGKLLLEIETIHCELTEGDLCYVSPYMYHCFMQTNPETLAMRFNVDFSDIQENTESPFQFLKKRLSEVEKFEVFSSMTGFEIFHACYTSIQNRIRYSDLTLNGLLTAFFAEMASRLQLSVNPDLKDVPLDKSIDVKTQIDWFFAFRSTDDPQPTVADLAQSIQYSVRQTERLIYQIYGRSFSQILTETRIHSSLDWLCNPELSLTRIAEMAGYHSYKGYCCAFKQEIGMQPSVYRRKLYENGFLKEAVP